MMFFMFLFKRSEPLPSQLKATDDVSPSAKDSEVAYMVQPPFTPLNLPVHFLRTARNRR